MSWTVLFHGTFDTEFEALSKGVQDELYAHLILLSTTGSRPESAARRHVGRVTSRQHEGVAAQSRRRRWRVAFAFDPQRRAIVLVARDKSGGGPQRFYKQLIRKADDRFDDHLRKLREESRR